MQADPTLDEPDTLMDTICNDVAALVADPTPRDRFMANLLNTNFSNEELRIASKTQKNGKWVRTRKGKSKDVGTHVYVHVSDVHRVSTLPIREAAVMLQISVTTLKCLCRRFGIQEWPRQSN